MKKYLLFITLCLGTNALASTKTVLNYTDLDLWAAIRGTFPDQTVYQVHVPKALSENEPGKGTANMSNAVSVSIIEGRITTKQCKKVHGKEQCYTVFTKGGNQVATMKISNNADKPITLKIYKKSDNKVGVMEMKD